MSYSVSLSPSAPAFHPKLLLSITPSPPSASSPVSTSDKALPTSSCELYTLLPIPPSLILDRYELHRLHSPPTSRLGAYDAPSGGKDSLSVQGEGDLEAPVWRVEEREPFRGKAAGLLRLKDGKGKGKEVAGQGWDRFEVEIPLHVRYQTPVDTRYDEETGERRDMVDVEVQAPWVFWACDAPDPFLSASSSSSSSCPFPPSSLPDPSLWSFPSLSSKQAFYYLHSSSDNSTSTSASPSAGSCPPSRPSSLNIRIPTGVMEDLPYVETITMLVVWLCAIWVGWGAWKAKGMWGNVKGEEGEKEKEGKED
ncbi:hypothetical protein JCM11251_002948 [Rhodosporidiobolus azoricus]